MLATNNPFTLYMDATGAPLDDGSVYFGVAGSNPITSPITVYWDAAGTQPAAQPIKTMNGYMLRAGTPSQVYASGDYSLLAKDKRGATIFYSQSSAEFSNDAVLLGQIGAIITNLASTASNAVGAGMVGADATLNYIARTIGAAIFDGALNVMWLLSEAERAQVKANTAAIDLTPKINAAKAWGGNRPLYLPAGTWSVSSLSFIGNKGGIVGDGIDVTILKVRSAVTTAIDLHETADANPNAGVLRGFTLDGNSLATNGIDLRYRHQISLDDLYIINCTNCLVEKDTYLARHKNVRTRIGTIGLWLVGSNHASTFSGCTFDGCSSTHLKVETNGTAADGNSALVFTGCDIEFGTGSSVGADITCTDITFLGCYGGENIPGASIVMRGGVCTIKGGSWFYGSTVNSYLVNPLGGKVTFDGIALGGQANPGIEMLVGTGTGGKVAFRDCAYNGLVSGTPTWLGDVLDYGPQGTVYAARLGKNWTGETNNTTITSVVTGNTQKFTCVTAPGPTPLIGAKCNLVSPSTWRDGETLYLVLVYESTKTLNVNLSASGFGGAPTKALAVALPATAGTAKTALCFQVTADNAAYTILEATQTSSAVNDFITIYECFLSDSRMLDKGSSQFGNLYKC